MARERPSPSRRLHQKKFIKESKLFVNDACPQNETRRIQLTIKDSSSDVIWLFTTGGIRGIKAEDNFCDRFRTPRQRSAQLSICISVPLLMFMIGILKTSKPQEGADDKKPLKTRNSEEPASKSRSRSSSLTNGIKGASDCFVLMPAALHIFPGILKPSKPVVEDDYYPVKPSEP